MNPDEQPIDRSSDYEEAYKRLRILARLCSSWMPDICDGISAEDLPNQVMLMFFESPDRLGWRPDKGPLERFLLGVLKHKMKDHYRRHILIVGSLDDPDFPQKTPPEEVEEMPTGALDADFLKIFDSNPELRSLIVAAENIVGGHNRNQQLAQELHTTTRNIVNLKRRLQKRLVMAREP